MIDLSKMPVEHVYNAMYLYCNNGIPKGLSAVLNSGYKIDINRPGDRGMDKGLTPLIIACKKNRESVVEMLLKVEGIDINKRDENGHTALVHACSKNLYGIVRMLVSQKDIDITMNNRDGWNVLLHECAMGGSKIVEILLEKLNFDQETLSECFIYACIFGRTEIARMLINTNFNVSLADSNECTPLWYACNHGSKGIVELLIQHGADFDKFE